MDRAAKCHICHNIRPSSKRVDFFWKTVHGLKLTPETERWTMFDGTECEQTIYRCDRCRRELEELENFDIGNRSEWIDGAIEKVMKSRTAKALLNIIPLWIYFRGGIA